MADPPVLPEPGAVPANWPVFDLRVFGADVRYGDARLVLAGTGVPVEAVISPGEQTLMPLEDLVVGESYDMVLPDCSGVSGSVVRYLATAPTEEPSQLGSIAVSRLYAANTRPGAAYRRHFVVVELTADPVAVRTPWDRALRWTVATASEPALTPAIGMSARELRVEVDCGDGVGLSTGPQEIKGVSFAPAARARVSTDVVMVTIESCDAALRVDHETLRPLTPEEIEYWDTAVMDAGPGPDWWDPDAGDDWGIDGGRPGLRTARDTRSNCSCTVAARTPPSGAAIAGLAGLAIAVAVRSRFARNSISRR
jgi:hypothetical protein